MPLEEIQGALTMKELCALGSFSMSTLYGLFKRGEGPKTFRVGTKGRRVRRETAIAWLEDLENRGGGKQAA